MAAAYFQSAPTRKHVFDDAPVAARQLGRRTGTRCRREVYWQESAAPLGCSVSQGLFDQKFGPKWCSQLPQGPGVYLFRDASDAVIYVGKAKNLRRRLQNYRNATAKRAHRKMRRLVRAATRIEFEELASEQAALLRENALIQKLKPLHNIEGAFAFLYPAIGVAGDTKQLILCFTTQPEAYAALGLHWYGTFRSRPRAKLAFDGLIELLSLIGHRDKRSALPNHPAIRGSRAVGLRQLPNELTLEVLRFFSGESPQLLGQLAKLLLEKPRALRDAALVQDRLIALKEFHEKDAARLRQALKNLGRPGSFVAQEERDALFIESQVRSL